MAEEISQGYRWVDQVCPVCNMPPTNFVGERGGDAHRSGLGVKCEIWSCGKCGMIFPNPMPHPVGGVDQHYGMEADEYFINHDRDKKLETARIILEDGEKMLGRKGTMLDIGAGRGEVIEVAISRGWKAEGVEPSKKFAAYAAEKTGAHIFPDPVESCGIEDNSYDLVILGAVLEHLYNPNDVVATIARILKPGGLVFFDVPNEKGLIFTVGNLYQKIRGRRWCTNLAPTFPPFHVFGYSMRPMRAMFGNHGLTVVKAHVFGGISVLPDRRGMMGKLENLGARAFTRISNLGTLGGYIAAWAKKS